MASTSIMHATNSLFDTPITPPPISSASSEFSFSATSTGYRTSRLPPASTVPHAGPSTLKQRYLYFAVRKGYNTGVYTHWHEAERQIVNYPEPVVKTFSTRLAAEAYVAGWDGAGRHSLPPSTPRPLREHLAMSFPGSVNVPYSPRRQSYHARLMASVPPPEDVSDFSPSVAPLSLDTNRPTLSSRSTMRHSMVKISSPLRQQVDEEGVEVLDEESGRPPIRKALSFMGAGGLLSPPQSPEKTAKRLSVMERERPTKSRGPSEAGHWSSRNHRNFDKPEGLGLHSPPTSPTNAEQRPTLGGTKRSSSRASGLWADAIPAQSSPLSPTLGLNGAEVFADSSAPKFSRSSLRKSGVVMPVAAKRTSSSNSLRLMTSRNSLLSPSPNGSSSSLNSVSSNGSDKTVRRQTLSAQDRLYSLSSASNRLTDEGLSALDSLSPPRPAFMRRTPSNSSIGSNDSIGSMGSMTSGSSAPTSSLDSCIEIEEPEVEEVVISCTKSDGDADGSVEGGSIKGVEKKKGGMFKRFAKALKLEKKGPDPRRGSL